MNIVWQLAVTAACCGAIYVATSLSTRAIDRALWELKGCASINNPDGFPPPDDPKLRRHWQAGRDIMKEPHA